MYLFLVFMSSDSSQEKFYGSYFNFVLSLERYGCDANGHESHGAVLT